MFGEESRPGEHGVEDDGGEADNPVLVVVGREPAPLLDGSVVAFDHVPVPIVDSVQADGSAASGTTTLCAPSDAAASPRSATTEHRTKSQTATPLKTPSAPLNHLSDTPQTEMAPKMYHQLIGRIWRVATRVVAESSAWEPSPGS